MAETTPAPQGSQPKKQGGGESASWIVGVILILLGIVFMLQQAGYVSLTGNWWALFIYVAAVGAFANAWRSYRSTREFGASATGSLIWGLVLTVVASIFIFNLLWEFWWPAILVAVGVGIVVGYLLREATKKPDDTISGPGTGPYTRP